MTFQDYNRRELIGKSILFRQQVIGETEERQICTIEKCELDGFRLKEYPEIKFNFNGFRIEPQSKEILLSQCVLISEEEAIKIKLAYESVAEKRPYAHSIVSNIHHIYLLSLEELIEIDAQIKSAIEYTKHKNQL